MSPIGDRMANLHVVVKINLRALIESNSSKFFEIFFGRKKPIDTNFILIGSNKLRLFGAGLKVKISIHSTEEPG